MFSAGPSNTTIVLYYLGTCTNRRTAVWSSKCELPGTTGTAGTTNCLLSLLLCTCAVFSAPQEHKFALDLILRCPILPRRTISSHA